MGREDPGPATWETWWSGAGKETRRSERAKVVEKKEERAHEGQRTKEGACVWTMLTHMNVCVVG